MCSSGVSYSTKLRQSMIDCKRKGYVALPETCKLRAAEVFDGGKDFAAADVECSTSSDGDKVRLIRCWRHHVLVPH